MKGEFRKVRIKIGHSFYTISTDLPDEKLQWLSEYISMKVREFEEETGITDPEKVFFFVALNVAEDVYNILERYEIVRDEVRQMSQKIAEALADIGQSGQSEQTDSQASSESEGQ